MADVDLRDSHPPPELTFPDVPQLALDELLVQLVARARDVASAQARLRNLLRAHRAIAGNLELPVVLRRIVEAACDLVGASYGALGVIGSGSTFEQFIQVGMDDDLIEQIEHPPEGKGVLGALITDPKVIRLDKIPDDPRSIGFPAGHPPMSSFLGVPIRIRGKVYGILYLADRIGGPFSFEDEELVLSLAASAAVAIENAHLYSVARHREAGLRASTEMTQELLANDAADPLRTIAERAREISDADLVAVMLPLTNQRLMIEIAVGDGADQLATTVVDRPGTLSAQAIDTGRPVMTANFSKARPSPSDAERFAAVGSVEAAMAIPLTGPDQPRGALVMTRHAGRPSFDDTDLDIATTFAEHAAVALGLADARADQQRLLLLEDRDRIAADLHDHVIQRLFAAGLTTQSVAGSANDPMIRERLERVVGDVDDTIRQIRSSIFELRGPVGVHDTARTRLLEVVSDTRIALGFDPDVRFVGPVDSAVPDHFLSDATAALRELLTNVARHASASNAVVTVTASPARLDIDVEDDGRGVGEPVQRSGLANLERRAREHGGELAVTPRTVGGTRAHWSIKLL